MQAALPSMQLPQHAAGAVGNPAAAITAAGKLAAADELAVSGLPPLLKGRQVPEARRAALQQNIAAILLRKNSKHMKLLMRDRSKQSRNVQDNGCLLA